jgi:hypothetical protein
MPRVSNPPSTRAPRAPSAPSAATPMSCAEPISFVSSSSAPHHDANTDDISPSAAAQLETALNSSSGVIAAPHGDASTAPICAPSSVSALAYAFAPDHDRSVPPTPGITSDDEEHKSEGPGALPLAYSPIAAPQREASPAASRPRGRPRRQTANTSPASSAASAVSPSIAELDFKGDEEDDGGLVPDHQQRALIAFDSPRLILAPLSSQSTARQPPSSSDDAPPHGHDIESENASLNQSSVCAPSPSPEPQKRAQRPAPTPAPKESAQLQVSQ